MVNAADDIACVPLLPAGSYAPGRTSPWPCLDRRQESVPRDLAAAASRRCRRTRVRQDRPRSRRGPAGSSNKLDLSSWSADWDSASSDDRPHREVAAGRESEDSRRMSRQWSGWRPGVCEKRESSSGTELAHVHSSRGTRSSPLPQLVRRASRVISGTLGQSLCTGQPAFAAAACFWKVASSMPGTRPTVTSSILVIVSGTVDLPQGDRGVGPHRFGGLPALASMLDRAIEKHEAWAAAISCSGFAPGPSSKRDLKEYSPLIVSPAVNVPLPVRKVALSTRRFLLPAFACLLVPH